MRRQSSWVGETTGIGSMTMGGNVKGAGQVMRVGDVPLSNTGPAPLPRPSPQRIRPVLQRVRLVSHRLKQVSKLSRLDAVVTEEHIFNIFV